MPKMTSYAAIDGIRKKFGKLKISWKNNA